MAQWGSDGGWSNAQGSDGGEPPALGCGSVVTYAIRRDWAVSYALGHDWVLPTYWANPCNDNASWFMAQWSDDDWSTARGSNGQEPPALGCGSVVAYAIGNDWSWYR